ncbi:hypothetical protein [Rhizobium sp. NXC24]|uniref:hypothetical protein n=1 Tax=Rhizobium sp. NXC24 TaxID=2048897 RepID=UPI000CDF31F6|nr:hypothetical protein [Rhizobium sp. NXC24]AVA20656.1 hypothetical protein NXC24_CH00989 [Rhizobium sp. NXC24]
MSENEIKDTSSATWKFEFADTVQADPMAKGGCLAVIRAYLNFASKADPKAFCPLPELMLRTGLSKPAIRRAKDTLTRLGYLEKLYVTEGGAVMYRLVNARKQLIDDHLRIARESLAAEQRDRKRRERKRSGGKETLPPKIVLEERNVTPVGNETLPNTVEESRRGSCSEGREGTYTHVHAREGSIDHPFDPPPSTEDGVAFLISKGVPSRFLEQALHRLMRHALFQCDIDDWRHEAEVELA